MGIFNRLSGKKEIKNVNQDEKEVIECFDKYGRKILITKEEWKEKILKNQLKNNWNDSDALYNDILSAIKDGFFYEVKDAAEHLKKIDTIKERGYTILAIVYMKCDLINAAQKVLEEYINKYGKTGTILANLAKVYSAKNNEEKSLEILWESLNLEPNQDNGLPWLLAIYHEKQGEEGYLYALKKTTEIKGSYLPQLFLARYYLEHNDLTNAKQLYDYILSNNKYNEEIMAFISGDMGKCGYVQDMIDIIEPLYDMPRHGPRVGLNLLQAYLDTKNNENGQILLHKLMKLERPELKDYLRKMSNEFEKLKDNKIIHLDSQEEVHFETIILNKPIWYYGLKAPEWLIPNVARHKKVGLLPYADITKSNAQNEMIEKEDEIGRMTRSIPLYIGEILMFSTCYDYNAIFPIALKYGPVITKIKYNEEYLKEVAAKLNLEYIITGSILEVNSGYEVENIVYSYNEQENKVISKFISKDNFGEQLGTMVDEIIARLPNCNLMNSNYYQKPNIEVANEYLSGLGQSLIQSCLDNEFIGIEKLWGERNILNWYLNLALQDPKNQVAKIMLVSGISKSKSYGSEVYLELKKQVLDIISDEKEENEVKKLLPFAYKIYDMENEFQHSKAKMIENSKDEKYINWLNQL